MSRKSERKEQVAPDVAISRRQVLAASSIAGMTGLAGLMGSDDVNGSQAGNVAQEGDITISFIPHSSGASDPFWAIEERGWSAAVDQLGVEGRFQGPTEFDPQQQVQNINSAISAGVDGIATSISDPDLFDDPLERAQEEGIPVLAVNIPEFGERTLPYQGYVGNDETVVGNEVASNAIEMFQEATGEAPSRAVIPNHQPGNQVLGLRVEGIQEVMENNDIPIDEIATSADPSENISSLASYRSSNSDLNLVLSLGPASGEPAIQWVEENDLQGEVYIAGVDITERIMGAIQDDIYFGTVIQQPYLQGYLAAHYLAQRLRNGILAPEVTPTGPTWIDASRLDLVQLQIEQTGGA